MNLETCRLWQVHFEIVGKLDNLPYPGEIVREVQDKSYYIDCSKRPEHRGGQLAYTLSGEGRFKIGDKVIPMLPGMAFLQNHNDARNAYYYPENGTEPWHFIWISFFSSGVEAMVKDITDAYGQIYHIPQEANLVKILFDYENHSSSLRFMSPFAGARLVMDILADLGNYTLPEESRKKVPTRLIKHAQEYIHNNIDKTINIEDVAAECEVSREHLSRVFKEQLSESPSSYLSKRRIRQACRLLVSTNLSGKEIAGRTGYDSAVSFNRTFKRITKMTPGEVRRQGYSPQIL
ncbi:MAG: helix-turn-helix domain-containing protein [Victivallaceae bacterium]|nr:helix-turn-helix domain-containing protein [Victivallaceae bacterium]